MSQIDDIQKTIDRNNDNVKILQEAQASLSSIKSRIKLLNQEKESTKSILAVSESLTAIIGEAVAGEFANISRLMDMKESLKEE
ncbi:hypothetical protein GUE55_15275 [Listeria monocytogenes]|uniref:hypothetical protein n=1 Tax=Listeria TaxID=1637 RepID=UPI0004320F2A|nr:MULTISPECIES: hypothetical protein [Listeria]EAF3078616.1 hypothetical protein [Listeria monocytogenes serotype 1/2a]EAC5142763.1 hypothetical protein [Listeria monocytogenes]EAC6458716.1 hypothetical protein [Listeria monocytogenes]EAC7687445.1 hypothetical protein [Listeria monocytogenes]EAC7907684.1 hypothetical protein [Listeria monocytogenes]